MQAFNLTDFLLWLVTGGSVVAVSWIMEQIAWFQSLTPNKRMWFQYVASALLGCAALAVQMYVPADVLDKAAPFFLILTGTFGMVFLNQIAHTLNPRKH